MDNIERKGLVLVISGPSGAGKGTICKSLVNKREDVHLSVSTTTRAPRAGEVEGINYHYITQEKFKSMIDNDELLEWAQIYGNFYGTPKSEILEQINRGINVVLEIEMQGAMQIKDLLPEAVFIFILPPSLDELKSRIIGRATETEEQINQRLSSALSEIRRISDYDYFIFNNVVEKSVEEIEEIIKVEKNKVIRYKNDILKLFEEE